MTRSTWTPDRIPDQTGRTAVVTGANSGIGYHAALELARKGAHVVLACRTRSKAEDAVSRIRTEVPDAELSLVDLDLASLDSVRAASEQLLGEHGPLHLLVANAGVMALPYRTTADGFEMQIGTNHLGHFALIGRLLPRLLDTERARVVVVSSMAHVTGRLDLDDLHRRRRYQKWEAYGQSKLANLLFTYELQRRLDAARERTGSGLIAVACHPGYAATNLQHVGPQMEGNRLGALFMRLGNGVVAQSAAQGAWPTLYAATAPDVEGGGFYGPVAWFGARGRPGRVRSNAASRSIDDANALWERSESETGVTYGL